MIWFGFIFFLYPQIPFGPKRPVYKQQVKVIKKISLFISMKSRLNSGYFMQITNKTKKQPDDRNVNQMLCFITKRATIPAPLSLQEGFIFHDPSLL